MKITEEWAKQLIHDAEGQDLDFGNMRVMFIPNVRDYRLSVYPVVLGSCQPVDVETVNIGKIGDPVNREVTRIGYSRKLNTLLVGETKSYEDPWELMQGAA
jgi:hypothetical protein